MVKICSGEPTAYSYGLELSEGLSPPRTVYLILDAPWGYALLTLAHTGSPVVVFTSNTCPFYLLDLLELNPEILLANPVSTHELRVALNEAASGQRKILAPPLEEYRQTLLPCERRVLRLLGFGLPNDEISRRLSIAPKTVANHISMIKEKLELRTSVELALYYRGKNPGSVRWENIPL